MRTSSSSIIACAVQGLAAVVAACAPPSPAQASRDQPGEHTLVRRVVPANVAAAEFVAFLVGPERIAALPEQVDDYSTIDFRADGFKEIARFSRYIAEPLIVLHPDLVVTHVWQSIETSDVLRRQGIDVLVLDSAQSWSDIRATIERLGAKLSVSEHAQAVIAQLEARTANVREQAARHPAWRALVYSNDGTGGYTAGSRTTADALLELVGLQNAAAEAGIHGHAALGFEKLIELDPDVIIVAAQARGEGGSPTRTVLLESSPLASLRAVREQRIAVLPAALLSSDSPCLIAAAEKLALEIERIQSTPGASVQAR